MKLIALEGLTKMSPLNELESTTCGVLFEASQTTAKS
jgi:hypothetical protein